ncbi:restriction endonuclease subunit S [Limosilactobacillus reuteri]|uniref:restriction endonuclease subunit S n=1 Tax=Limosilactobacillus reuteri TaxID=1598 RepID=UPI00128AF73D|nr:restriction endonuclease subunit S [Limosilactobacillus reuteri]MQB57962.1 restriction endonuclease subunit S [Limosilactobacillus reuteri]MQC03474.1 restriction endonuclease subunit S [Limosilactobacillus reuteri]
MDKKPEKLVPEVRFKGFTDDWEQRKLRKVACINPKTNIPDNFKYVDLESVVGTSLIKAKLTTKQLAPSRAQRVAKKGDIFYQTVRPYQKNNFLFDINNYDFQYVFSTGYAQLRSEINNYFLFSYLQRQRFVNLILRRSTGTSYPAISSKDLSEIKIIFPRNSKEQENIGKIINLIDALITLQQRKLELLKEIKKGLLQKMFADKSKFPILRFEGFHNEWEQRKLKNVYQKIGNAFVGTASPYYVDAGHFYLESNNIKNGQINRNHEVFINNSFYQKQSNKLLHTGDLVMVQSGHVGDTAVITQEYNNSAAHALIMFRNPKDKFLSDYLNFYFQNTSAKNKINVLAIGNTIRHVLASDMSRFSVYFPNKDERKYISNLLLKLQYTITLQQSKISQLTILKKYLLQKLFI